MRSNGFNYRGDFGADYHRSRKLEKSAEDWICELRAKKVSRWIMPDERVLEYGVGFGWNLARVNCAEKVGFDLTEGLQTAVEAKGIRFESSEENLRRGAFDAVLLHHVLEHVPNPLRLLLRLRGFLAPGGKLLLFVPFERERKYRRYGRHDRSHHVGSWTCSSAARLVQEAGWMIEHSDLKPFRFDRIAAVVNAKVGGGFRTYHYLRGMALRLLPEYEIAMLARPLPA